MEDATKHHNITLTVDDDPEDLSNYQRSMPTCMKNTEYQGNSSRFERRAALLLQERCVKTKVVNEL